MGTPESPRMTETKLKRIAWLSSKDSEKQYQCLMHLFNEESLTECYYELSGNKAVGADGITKQTYGENLAENIKGLIARMKRMAYKPSPIRQAEIPKEGKKGEVRMLGISNFEDKLVQKMMEKVLESIYEPVFLNCSYGFRANMGCHDALRALNNHLYENKVATVIDLDFADFFGSLNHQVVEEILREKVKDEKFIRYIIRMLKAGVLSGGELTVSEEGIVQGSCCSPVLANIFAHYVLDEWFERVVKTHCKGKTEMFRYADDVCICCESENDARRIKAAVAKRLAKYGLKLNEEKTELVQFSKGTKGNKAFDFLGFTFYWGLSKKGFIIPKVKTSGKRMRSKLKRVNQWAKRIRNMLPLGEIWKLLKLKLNGHIRYFSVSHNIKRVRSFIYQVTRIMFKWLNRRSQKKSFTWDRFKKYTDAHPLPKVRICHSLC